MSKKQNIGPASEILHKGVIRVNTQWLHGYQQTYLTIYDGARESTSEYANRLNERYGDLDYRGYIGQIETLFNGRALDIRFQHYEDDSREAPLEPEYCDPEISFRKSPPKDLLRLFDKFLDDTPGQHGNVERLLAFLIQRGFVLAKDETREIRKADGRIRTDLHCWVRDFAKEAEVTGNVAKWDAARAERRRLEELEWEQRRVERERAQTEQIAN